MGQYHRTACLDTREFIDCHALGDGLKLAEQVGGNGGVASALFVLLAASNGRGGGDLEDDETGVVGRWAGKRVVVIGDYAEDTDYAMKPGDPKPTELYGLCRPAGEKERKPKGAFKDITPLARPYMESLGYAYTGDGWVTRYALWDSVEGLECTYAGDEKHGRIARVGVNEYWQRDIVAALGKLPQYGVKLPVPISTLVKLGLKPLNRNRDGVILFDVSV